MSALFGTDGIRGVANRHPMTPEIAFKVGRACGAVFRNHGRRHKILVGKDTRVSGYMFETALTSGMCSMGMDCELLGPIPTPGIAFLTQSVRADAGVVISASHNPYYDNGIKIFDRDGFKLSDEIEARIESLVTGDASDGERPTHHEIGRAHRMDDASGRYISFLKTVFPRELTLEGTRIVVDCANGAFYKIAPAVFSELGATVTAVATSPDGFNINDGCGALHPGHMAAVVRETGSDLGIALDGDGDRVIFCDSTGEVVDGDKILGIIAACLLSEHRLRKKTLVATVMSNMALDEFVESHGGSVLRVGVGDRHVVEALRSQGLNLGGEQSGHIVAMDYTTTGDGVVAALKLLKVMLKKGRSLKDLASEIVPYPQVLFNINVQKRVDYLEIPAVHRAIEHAVNELSSCRGRVFIRYSGTEPKLRVMIECKDEALVRKWEGELRSVMLAAIPGAVPA